MPTLLIQREKDRERERKRRREREGERGRERVREMRRETCAHTLATQRPPPTPSAEGEGGAERRQCNYMPHVPSVNRCKGPHSSDR